MFPLLGAEGCAQQQKPFMGVLIIHLRTYNPIRASRTAQRWQRENGGIKVAGRAKQWIVGPGGSEASDELPSTLFVLWRLMWIQMDRSRMCINIYSRLPPSCQHDTHARGRKVMDRMHIFTRIAYGTTVRPWCALLANALSTRPLL